MATKTELVPVNKLNSSNKGYQLLHFLLLLLVPFIIYFYFLRWKTISIHDDDLFLYMAHLKDPSYINISVYFGQFRPVRDFFLHNIIQLFDKNFTAYYCFNVAIQSINTILFAYLLNLLLRNLSISLFLSLILGLSRFCFYNVTQLFNGGVLEGLAITSFLIFLFFTVSIATKAGTSVYSQKRGILLSILFANLTLYTHERYIVIFPFIFLMILFFPKFRGISMKWRISISLIAIASIFLNIIIKAWFYSLAFFKGTGNTDIKFSFSSAIEFLGDSIWGILQYSKGPEYLTGLQFSSLPFLYKTGVFFIIILLAGTFGLYLWKIISAIRFKKNGYPPNSALFIFLSGLFILCLIPAILQTRMELRWFQASLAVLILMFVIGINYLADKNIKRKYLLYSLFGASFLGTNYYYVYKGSKNLYYSTSASIGNAFDKAIKDNSIHLEKRTIYILEKERNASREGEINWALASGNFFIPYKSSTKNLVFIDSYFSNFDSSNDEIIYLDIQNDRQTFKYTITNITNEYIKDSLQKFIGKTSGRTNTISNTLHANMLKITNETIKDFKTDGFYDNENGIRWTNGNASIAFKTDYYVKDSVIIKLSTYMPPPCSNVNPKIFLTGLHEKEYEPSLIKREAGIFIFKFYFSELTAIEKINIRSERIKNTSASDKRILSFPFISLEIN